MMSQEELQKRFQLVFEPEKYRRIIAGKEVIVHCHHYNARLQNTIEGSKHIEGKEIILAAAEEVFSEYVRNAFSPEDSVEDKWQVAVALYAHLGYGRLDISRLHEGIVAARTSHFVEGWNTGFRKINQPVCTFTEGYLQGVIHGIRGESVWVREDACMQAGSDHCRFIIDKQRSTPITFHPKQQLTFTPKQTDDFIHSPNIDEGKIIQALVEMPFYGNNEGLIPAFNVYLANTPANFYNLICIRFVEEMRKQNLQSTAKKLLMFAGEICALNTLRGIKNSPEWDGLIAPMVKEDTDNLYGLIAVTNGLGWGNWHVCEHDPGETLTMESLNGYEALGHLKYMGEHREPHCFMLTGVTSGIMALLYREGTVEERLGSYYSEETACIFSRQPACTFNVEAV